ncbi:aldehyde dehydrogenase family protein [Saccharothrix sp. ST-888]|uniref:aldehyde dehydrogenase family protein n=1 Tax=Saccharothrix sp. ST-888 TaxID=1427391 RepID=UPI0007C71D06|nr:aldehyde dehydrogenase family protein [Saccharothrix sp. ST-888]
MSETTPMTATVFRWSSRSADDLFPVEDPATGEVIALVQGGGADEVDAAVRAAHHAFEGHWRSRPPQERARLLLRCADVLAAHADELAALESLENGKPVGDARMFDVGFLIDVFRFFGSLVDKLPGEFYDKGAVHASVVLEPLGVVGGIIPFNWPPIHTGGKIAPALAVGNTVVLKPSEQAPLTIMRIVDLLNTVLPPDVLHAVPGLGPTAGQALAGHPLVRKVSFTGSTAAGRAVARTAAGNLTPVLLELGGKNAFLVFDDADLDRAVRDALEGGYFNKGEACTAASRILVQRGVHDDFVERLAAGVRALRVGSGADPTTHVGPVVSRAQQERVLDYLRIGTAEGAVVAAQAALPDDPALAGGFFVAPTLFTGVRRDMRVAVEEVFGPVVTVTAFDTEEEAVAIANESEFGLMCGVYSRDAERALRLARRIDVGTVFVNNYFRGILGTPFGGTKHSGYGREHSIETLKEFGYAKAIRTPSGLGSIPSWRAVTDIFGPAGSEIATGEAADAQHPCHAK